MVARRSERRRYSASWEDESETTAVVEDSAVRCSSATDLPGATPMTAAYHRRRLATSSERTTSRASTTLPCWWQRRQRLSRSDVSENLESSSPSDSPRRRRKLGPSRSSHRRLHQKEVFPEATWPRTRSWWTTPATTAPCYRRTSSRRPDFSLRSSLVLLVLLCVLLQQPLLVLGSGVFELRLGSFSNPSNRDSQGACCSTGLPPATEGTPCPGSPCRVSFRVCLKHYQKTVDTDSPCTYGELSTPVLVQSTSDGAIFNASRPPITFPFEFSWPGTFSLIIEAWHEGPAPAGGSASSSSGVHRTLVAQMSTQKWLDVGDSWTPGTLQRERAALSYSYRVRCQEFYYGSECAKLCRPRDDKFGHFTCSASGDVVCLPGWKGDYCTKAICLKGCKEPQGDCDRPNECKCRIGWEGPLCDRCVRYPGCLHGTCSQPWQCNCDEGWGGLFCNQDLNYCTNNRPCRHGGTCTNTGQGSYTCSCLPGYAGTDCEIVQDPCLASPCQNGGICRATDSSSSSTQGYTCSCPPGLAGRHCEVPHNACDSHPCLNGGSCREAPDTPEGYRCLCPDAYAGDRCEVQRDPCEPSPCANGGTCVTLSDGNSRGDGGSEQRYRCECLPGFEGPHCRTNIDDCASDPCLNGATCLDGVDTFRCLCRPGFVGLLCDHDVDDCLTYPCANGGRCEDLVNDFSCKCPAGFSGKDCSVNLDDCASSPCLNGGVCVDLAGRFECRCPEDFGGDRCEHRPPALAPRVAVVPPSPGRSSARRGGEDIGRHDLLTREDDSRGRSDEDALSSVQLALIVTASVTVPLIALVAALVILCQRRRWKERRDAEAAMRQNERNAVQHHGMNNKGAGSKAPPHTVVVNTLVDKPLQKKANGENNASSSSSTSTATMTGTAKVLNVDARAQSKLSLDVDTTLEGVHASTRTLNRLYQEPGGGGGIESDATMAAQHVLDRASLRGSSPKSCDSRVVDSTVVEEDDIVSIKQQLQQQPQPVTGGNSAVYVIEDHYRDENLLATEV